MSHDGRKTIQLYFIVFLHFFVSSDDMWLNFASARDALLLPFAANGLLLWHAGPRRTGFDKRGRPIVYVKFHHEAAWQNLIKPPGFGIQLKGHPMSSIRDLKFLFVRTVDISKRRSTMQLVTRYHSHRRA